MTATSSETDSEHILVLGAGELGVAVLTALAARGHPTLSVLLRPSTITSTDPRKQDELTQLRTLGIDTEPGDIAEQSVTELASIFSRFDTVISCVGFAAGPGTQLKLTQAALQSGVERYLPWQFGVDYDAIGRGGPQDLFDEQLAVRDLLRAQQQTEWIIISTGMFTSFLFEPAFGVVNLEDRTVHALGDWTTAVTLTTPQDIGRLTAEIICRKPRVSNEVVYVAGDTITYGELADIVEHALGIKVGRVRLSVPRLLDDLRAEPGDAMTKYRAVFGQGVGVAWNKDNTFNAQHNIETMSALQWACRHLRTARQS